MNPLRETKYSGGKIPSRSDLRGKVLAQENFRLRSTKRRKLFTFAAWNVRSLCDSRQSKHPERRTAIVSKELYRLNVDIAAISETRLPGEGCLAENEYTFYWKGYPEDQNKKLHGVGFAIKNNLATKLQQAPQAISERLMTLRYPIGHNKFVTVISVYAPTLKADPEITDAFYQSLEEVLNKTPIQDRLILMDDFNARVGREHNIWEKVIGKHGIGNMNANGELLLTKCWHGLTITNTLFMHNDKFKGTWQRPRSKHWHQLDHVIVRQRDLKEVLDTKA
ncbi:craniofacial development protein 2-like [Sitophilus oryzae]|uniref:Craniofacial development protein 2-like n=1 Tax=Sitophilus oryzae TaxID=7048 RepID=A0A6J2X773_SITOR|nr:craniofacial development protein 2-like [Sitophilus oryzae]